MEKPKPTSEKMFLQQQKMEHQKIINCTVATLVTQILSKKIQNITKC
jgi:hypothetical protein